MQHVIPIAALDAQIEAHYAEIARLKARRNASSKCFAACLPLEILAVIFSSYLADLVSGHDRVSHFTAHQRFATRVIPVCRRWWSVAMSTSTLWSEIYTGQNARPGGIDYVKTLLERSHQALLHINIECLHWEDMNYLRLVIPHIHRARELYLAVAYNDHYDRLLDWLPSSAPHLKSLHTQGPQSDTHEETSFLDFASRCSTPSLKTLTITWDRIYLTSAALPHTLTKLVVKFKGTFPVEELVQGAAQLHALEYLELKAQGNTNSHLLDPARNAVAQVTFRRLKALTIDGMLSALVSHLLDQLHIPPSAQIDISFPSFPTRHDSEATSLTSSLNRQLDTLIAGEVQVVVDRSWFSFGCISSTNVHPRSANLFVPRLRLYINEPCLWSAGVTIRDGLFSLPLALQNASVLSLHDCPLTWGDSILAWTQFLGRLEHVETAILSMTPSPGMPFRRGTSSSAVWYHGALLALLRAPVAPAATFSTTVITDAPAMPQLKHIVLKHVNFHLAVLGRGDCTVPFLESLRSMIFFRANAGCKVEDLVLERCWNVDERDISWLSRECEGVSIVWDGHVQYVDSHE